MVQIQTREIALQTLEELLPNLQISDFCIDWIVNSNVTQESVSQVHSFLKNVGVENKTIAANAQLLGKSPEEINQNYNNLRNLGLSNTNIISRISLLSMDPLKVNENYRFLKNLGLSDAKIATQAYLLTKDPETI